MLENEYEYYKNNKKSFDEKYDQKYIVIKEKKILGIYIDQNIALTETLKNHKPGTFLIQKCSNSDDQIMRFHSRVDFAKI